MVAGYDENGVIHDYVVFLIRSLSDIADVYYYADGHIAGGEIAKVRDYVKWYGAGKHGKYDFGSWQKIINHVGWDIISQYDEIIMANDSVYGPVFDLEPTFEKIKEKKVDFWGVTISKQIECHLQSYFMVFNKNIIMSDIFRSFWNNIGLFDNNHLEFVRNHEIKLSRTLTKSGFSMGALAKSINFDNPCFFPLSLMADFGSPFVKVKCYKDPMSNLLEDMVKLNDFISKNTKYNLNYVLTHNKKESNSEFDEKSNLLSEAICIDLIFITIYTSNKEKMKLLIFNKKIISIKVSRRIISLIYKCRTFRRRLKAEPINLQEI